MPGKDANGKTTWTTGELVVAVVITSALAAALVGSFVAMFAEADEEERPPIIVNSGGSIVFEPNAGLFGKKGKWKEVPSIDTKKAYHHEHEKQGPRYLQVKANPNEQVCQASGGAGNFKTPVSGLSMAIKYGKDGTTETAVVSVLQNYLQLTFDNAPYFDPTHPEELVAFKANDDVRVLSVVVDNVITCTFTKDTKLKITQLR